MTPKFSAEIDRIFLHVLELLGRIESGRNVSLDQERAKIIAKLGEADAKLGQSADWTLAKYAVVSWIDEVLSFTPWSGASRWPDMALEPSIYGGASQRYVKYFQQAQAAATASRGDAAEVFYLGVVLGFRGVYREIEALRIAETTPDAVTAELRTSAASARREAEYHRLPLQLSEWLETMSASMTGRKHLPQSTSVERGVGAPPLSGSGRRMAAAMLLATMLAALLVTLVFTVLLSQ